MSTKRINVEQLEYVVGMMRSAQKAHPKADVRFDLESQEVLILYSVPDDFYQITDIKIDREGMR